MREELKPILPPYPLGHDHNTRCDFHASAPGHSVENFKELKYKVQELIVSKEISFTPKGPNVKNNHITAHVGPFVNVIKESINQELVTEIDKSTMMVIQEQLFKHGLIPENHVGCEDYISNPESREKLKDCMQ